MKKFLKGNVAFLFAVVLFAVGAFTPSNIAKAASGDSIVYITNTGKCYHLDGCTCLRRSKIATTLQAAIDKGLYPCSKCNPGSLDASTPAQNNDTNNTTKAVTKAQESKATVSVVTVDPSVEALKNYKGNTKSFNAYDYYMNNADLQSAVGVDGDALLKHYNKYGKKEGRVAINSNATSSNPSVEALKTYKGNTKNFNAYVYYSNNADLQVAIGPDGDSLLKHYNEYGKTEGRIAN